MNPQEKETPHGPARRKEPRGASQRKGRQAVAIGQGSQNRRGGHPVAARHVCGGRGRRNDEGRFRRQHSWLPPNAKAKDTSRRLRRTAIGCSGKSARIRSSHQRTMVPPANASSTASPGSIDSKLDKWKMPREERAEAGAEPLRRADCRRRRSRQIRPSRPTATATTSSPAIRCRASSRKSRTASARSRTNLPPPPLDVKKWPVQADSVGSVTTREGFERGESSGYADAGSPPRHREKSRYDDASAALMAPAPPPREKPYDAGGRSYAGSSRSQYDDDFPRNSETAAYDRDRPHRYDSPSYGNHSLRHDGKYDVEPNDSYWTISEKVYGTGGYFKALAEQNRSKIGNEDRLTPGDVILTPSVAQLEKSYPELCPKPSRRETQESRTMAVSTRGRIAAAGRTRSRRATRCSTSPAMSSARRRAGPRSTT